MMDMIEYHIWRLICARVCSTFKCKLFLHTAVFYRLIFFFSYRNILLLVVPIYCTKVLNNSFRIIYFQITFLYVCLLSIYAYIRFNIVRQPLGKNITLCVRLFLPSY